MIFEAPPVVREGPLGTLALQMAASGIEAGGGRKTRSVGRANLKGVGESKLVETHAPAVPSRTPGSAPALE